MTDVYQGSRATASEAVATAAEERGLELAQASLQRMRRPPDRQALRATRGTWSSSLGSADLACLMSVLEDHVLPHLVREYRPADGLPRGRCIG